jgi:RNA polymerase sigma-70 factor (ECF subfamily)
MTSPDAAAVFDRHHLQVFRFLRRMTGNPTLAEDLTQEVFLRVVRGLGTYEDRERQTAWVFRIARNVLVDRHRAEARTPTSAPIEDVGPQPVPASQALGAAIEQALRRLPEEEREAFLMREVAGLGYADIAHATGATPDAARMRIYRARVALRASLGSPWRAAETA